MSFGDKLSLPARCFSHCFGSNDRTLASYYFCNRLRAAKPYVTRLVSNLMIVNPGSNEISSNKDSRSIEVYFPILLYKYIGSLITDRLIGGHLM